MNSRRYGARMMLVGLAGNQAVDTARMKWDLVWSDPPEKITAIHEAGHGTVRAVFGFPVGEIRYFSDGSGVCSADPVGPDYNPGAGPSDKEAIVAMGELCGRPLDSRLIVATEKILIRHWDTVLSLAQALIDSGGYLNASQIAEVLGACGFAVQPAAARNQNEAGPVLAR